MSQNERENQSDPELLIDIESKAGAFTVKVRRGGTVRYLDTGYKTRDAAWEAGRVFVKNWLRAQISASGIGRCAERPAFFHVGERPLEPGAWPAATLEPHPWPGAELPLEGEQLCLCGHGDGVHELGANSCHGRNCECREFAAVLAEAVQ